MVARGWGKRRVGSYYLMGMEFQFGKMKKALEMDGGDVDVLNATELHT